MPKILQYVIPNINSINSPLLFITLAIDSSK